MAKKIIDTFESLNLIIKIVLLVIFGTLIGGIYRILKYTETKNVSTLVIGILGLVTFIGNIVLEVVDIVSEVLNNKIEILVEV